MHKVVELPIAEPLYKTFHYQGAATATITENPSLRNWYLSQTADLMCTRRFLHGLTTPEITIPNSSWQDSPHFLKYSYPMRFAGGYIHHIIRELVDNGYYVVYEGVDDYYVAGKTWYRQRHFDHDGLICGYNREDKTYCLYAYDSNWIYRKFWTPQKGFDRGRVSMLQKGKEGYICGIKPKVNHIAFSPENAYSRLLEYLDSTFLKYPKDGEGNIRGIVVHNYIAEYVQKLFAGSVPYDRMDRRVFRVIWEHKKAMLERIVAMEQALEMDNSFSRNYRSAVKLADVMRMQYASHHMKRRDSVLPAIYRQLLELAEQERTILSEFIEKIEREKRL